MLQEDFTNVWFIVLELQTDLLCVLGALDLMNLWSLLNVKIIIYFINNVGYVFFKYFFAICCLISLREFLNSMVTSSKNTE